MKFHKFLRRDGYILSKEILTVDEIKKIEKDLNVAPEVNYAFKDMVKVESFPIYRESPNYLYVPRFYGIREFGPPIKNKLKNGKAINLKFKYDLLPHQHTSYAKMMNNFRTVGGGVLSLPCGYGKTALAIKAACELGVKTLVIVTKEYIADQWEDSLYKFVGNHVNVGKIQQKVIKVEDKDFVIAILNSIAQKDYLAEIFEEFGLCIFDEVHHLGAQCFSQALPKVGCKYMLGLSATPNRKDGLSKVFYGYLGELFHSEKRNSQNQVFVKRIVLSGDVDGYEEVRINMGRKPILNISRMLSNLSESVIRNKIIIDGIIPAIYKRNIKPSTKDKKDKNKKTKNNRVTLFLSARREHLKLVHDSTLEKELSKNGKDPISVGYYVGRTGTNRKKHKAALAISAKCDLILGTDAMASEALDIPEANCEVQSTPSTDVQQKVGRILRKFHENLHPVVIDVVDNFSSFINQARQRKKFYLSEEYIVQDLKINIKSLTHPKDGQSLPDGSFSDMEDIYEKISEFINDTELDEKQMKKLQKRVEDYADSLVIPKFKECML